MLNPRQHADPSDTTCGREAFRPQFHFTSRRNWINDPNGLVWFAGEYHLFYQYNPFGKDWGHMSWGHAISSDLVHWQELPVAIPETDQMVFSGCCIVDHANLSGLGDGISPPLLAFFTAYDQARDIQSQHLAFSHDRGRSFTHHAGNPIIDHGLAHFRDPKVFYHAESAAWIMIVAMAREHAVRFYRSDDLIDWTLAGSFGPAGSTSGQWECPDLIRVPVAGRPGEAHWVLKVDIDTGLVDGGSGAQYFVGDFDGTSFTIDPVHGSQTGELVDLGPDFYAAVTWSDLPDGDPAPVWIGWQSNHQSGKAYPTDPWRGAMSLPRALFLFEEAGLLRLGQRPVRSLADLREPTTRDLVATAGEGLLPVRFEPGSCFEQHLRLDGDAAATVELVLRDETGPLLTVAVSFARSELAFERHGGSMVEPAVFARRTTTRLPSFDQVDLHIVFDVSLIEIFVDDGRRVYSACLFPQGPLTMESSGAGRVTLREHFAIRRSMDFGD